MNTTKRIFSLLLVMCLLLAMTACDTDEVLPKETTENTAATESTTASTDATTEPTEATTEATVEATLSTDATLPEDDLPIVTAPTEAEGSAPTVEVTVPAETEPQPTKPAVQPAPTEPMKPTTPSVPTEPPATEPVTTKPTEPPATQPAHKHSYSTKKYEATCIADGYTLHTCACGDSYRDSEVKVLGHDYKAVVTAPTTASGGYTTYTCQRCGDSYKDNFTDPIQEHTHSYTETLVEPTYNLQGYTLYTCECGHSYEDNYYYFTDAELKEYLDDFEKDVEKAVLKYINQYRGQQGRGSLSKLSGLTKVARYRSGQLVYRFEHNTADMRKALAYYKYGRYVDATLFGGDASESYYTHDGREAISRSYEGVSDADAIGKRIATAIKNSSSHWGYVGSAEYTFVGVGVTYEDNTWNVCVIVTDVNYG